MSSGRNKCHTNHPEMSQTTRQQVIEVGLDYLSGVGAEHVCKVCIASKASCCSGCAVLIDGIGCQQRNTSCTSWLCGFLKFIYYKAGLITEWYKFWDQVPGLDYRRDFTPAEINIEKWIEPPNIQHLSEAFALDLEEQRRNNYYPFWVLETKETLDRYIDQILQTKNPIKIKKIEKKMSYLTRDFRRFHEASKITISKLPEHE